MPFACSLYGGPRGSRGVGGRQLLRVKMWPLWKTLQILDGTELATHFERAPPNDVSLFFSSFFGVVLPVIEIKLWIECLTFRAILVHLLKCIKNNRNFEEFKNLI